MAKPATRRILISAGLLVPILVLFLLGWNIEPRPNECTAQRQHQSTTLSKPEPATLSLKKGENTTVPFGRSLETERLTIRLDVVKGKIVQPLNPLKLLVGQFRREGDADASDIPARRIFVNATVESLRLVALRICVDRDGPIESTAQEKVDDEDPSPPHPGTYVGDVTITDRRVSTITVPITIKLAYSRWPYVALLWYFVALVGSVYVWALREKRGETDLMFSFSSIGKLGQWSSRWGGIVSIIAGSIGALTVFVASYLQSPDWGNGVEQILSLFGAMFTAFVTAGTAPHVVNSATNGSNGAAAAEEHQRPA